MAETFSQSVTGVSANHRYGIPKVLQVGDLDIAGNVVGGSVSAFAGQQGVMSRGGYILCKGPDGAQTYHVIDAERSIPGQYIVLRKV